MLSINFVSNLFLHFFSYIAIPIAIRYLILKKPIQRRWIAIGILIPLFIGWAILDTLVNQEYKISLSNLYLIGSPVLYIAMVLSYGILRRKNNEPESEEDKNAVDETEDTTSSIEIYKKIAEEMDRKDYQKGLATKAIAEAKGDKELSKSLYIKFRYEELCGQLELERKEKQQKQVTEISQKRPLSQKLLLGVITVVTVITLVIGIVLYFTAGIVDSANAFFMAVKQKDMVKARTYLAEDFKASTHEDELSSFLSDKALLNFKESSWSYRQINSDGRGELNGSIITETGGVVPIKMTFVKEKEEWKIYAIEKTDAGLQTESTTNSSSLGSTFSLPDKTRQTAMVKQAMHDFLISVTKKDMSHFHSTVSTLWQKQFTVEQLNQAFKPITDSDANWGVLENIAPVLTSEIKADANGVIVLTGYYPTKPSQVNFEQKYLHEGNTWKLLSLSIQATASSKTPAAAIPDKIQQNTMVKQAMHDFLVSVAQKNMTHFRSTASTLWQEQFSVEQFNATYKAISDSNANWAVLEKVEPVLTSEVKADENGVIVLAGNYPTKPSQVQFEQKYIYEGNAWKLVGFSFEAK